MWQIVHLVIERSGIRSAVSYWTVSIVDVACNVVPKILFFGGIHLLFIVNVLDKEIPKG
jgi:hypothetical protein